MAEPKDVLVIDDDPLPREFLRALLEGKGWSVRLAEGGEAGLAQIAEKPPDLVLLDLTMRGLSGWGVINRLRVHAAPPPVIAMAGMGDDEPPELTAISPFVHGYLPKPLRAELVALACARVLAPPPETPPESERRSEARRDLVVPATLSAPDGAPIATGELLDITTAGAQFNLGAALPPGGEMTLAFEVPGGDGPFRVAVRSLWNEGGRLGLAFVDLAGPDADRLARLLDLPS